MSFLLTCLFFSTILINTEQLAPYLKKEAKSKLSQYKDRCTRRYTPGVCADNNVSVWTFEYQIMNCTERLGCPQSQRTNRFRSFRSCLNRCMPLIDLYLQILSSGSENDTMFFLRNRMQVRRIAFEGGKGQASQKTDYEDPIADEAVMTSILYGDNVESPEDEVEETLRGDVDSMMGMRDPDDYFPFH